MLIGNFVDRFVACVLGLLFADNLLLRDFSPYAIYMSVL
jgi:hypothetical protein